jgi:hypothetical protein
VCAVAGCGTTTIVRTTGQAASSQSSQSATGHELTIGSSATLSGQRSGESLEATTLAYKPTLSVGEYDRPDPGMKFVGVTLKLKNVGTAPYSDAPSNGATILTASGQHGKTAIITSGECSEGFAENVKIAGGESQEGCIAFELPQADEAAKFQWTPSSGFGNETAEWSLQASASTAAPAGSTGTNGSLKKCDPNVSVNSVTTCPFAENVFKAFSQHAVSEGSTTVEALSPVTHQSYHMTCAVSAGTVNCSGGHEALVVFSLHSAQVH